MHWAPLSLRPGFRASEWPTWLKPLLFASVLAAGIFAAAKWYFPAGQPASAEVRDSRPAERLLTTLPPPDLLRALGPEEAVQANAQRPFAIVRDEPASSFHLRTDAANHERAVDCLAQAVYFEANGEGIEGGRAVAQLVLNRMRHPAFPATVCGVVFQGSERATGCQFTFTCDGSLRRARAGHLWTQSRKIAEEALTGRVSPAVGHATHYHADYVLPYWADSLEKMVQIGRHIYYRLPGRLSSAAAFTQRYAGLEPLVEQLDPTALLVPEDAPSSDGTEQTSADPLAIAGAEPSRDAPALLADTSSGTLILDDGRAGKADRDVSRQASCSDTKQSLQLRPLAKQDLRSTRSPDSC